MNIKFRHIIYSIFCVFSLACARMEEVAPSFSEGVELTLTAVREGYDPSTKTVRLTDGSVEWCPSEEISVFYGNGSNGGSKFISQNKEQSPIAEFKGKIDGITAGSEGFVPDRYIYGIYPYSLNTSFSDGVATITLPSGQTASEDSFSSGLFPTIGRSKELDIAFYNICGGVKFTVSRNDITSVIFKGNNNERLAGTAKIAFDSNEIPVVLEDEIESKDEIVVYAPAGGTFEAGKDYYIVAYPTKFSSGFTMTFRTSDMKEGVYVHDNEVEIMRSYFGVLNNVDENVDSWTDLTYAGGGNDSGIYLGVMGFNQQLYSYPISKLTIETKAGFDSFIDDLAMKNGTLLYYSVDQTINTMQSVQLPPDLTTAAIVTFTDGLDQGSIMMNVSYQDNTEYLNAINNRITSETIGGQPITAYSIGIRGQDVADVTTFKNNLEKLASSPENATEVTSMAEVNAKFKEIAEQLSQNNYIQTINLKMPGVSNGTVVRFTFDNINSATKSKLYIEGTFNLAERSLEDIKYVGLSSSSGSYVKGVVDGIFVTFTFENVHADNNILIDNQFTDEWIYVPSSNIWQINSEFDKNENSDIVNVRSSAAIMLVLDCSSSLADDFVKAQTNAKDFINTLYEAVGGDNGSGNLSDSSDNEIYSTIPINKSIAVWMGKRYYLTSDQYSNANLSNAIIEGVAIVSGEDSFIVSPKDAQAGPISSVETAFELYRDIIPTAEQGKLIGIYWDYINYAIKYYIGGDQLYSSRYYYTADTELPIGWVDAVMGVQYRSLIHGFGGDLWNSTDAAPYVRGVRPTTYSTAIVWNK